MTVLMSVLMIKLNYLFNKLKTCFYNIGNYAFVGILKDGGCVLNWKALSIEMVL